MARTKTAAVVELKGKPGIRGTLTRPQGTVAPRDPAPSQKAPKAVVKRISTHLQPKEGKVMASTTTHEDKAPAHAEAPKAAPLTPAGINLLIAMLATDWVVGDKHHYAAIRAQALRLLTDLGKDGAETKARLEGLSGMAPPVVEAHPAKAA